MTQKERLQYIYAGKLLRKHTCYTQLFYNHYSTYTGQYQHSQLTAYTSICIIHGSIMRLSPACNIYHQGVKFGMEALPKLNFAPQCRDRMQGASFTWFLQNFQDLWAVTKILNLMTLTQGFQIHGGLTLGLHFPKKIWQLLNGETVCQNETVFEVENGQNGTEISYHHVECGEDWTDPTEGKVLCLFYLFAIMLLNGKVCECKKRKKTHTHNTQPFYCSCGICPGPPGWAGTRKVKPGRLKPLWIYWSKR